MNEPPELPPLDLTEEHLAHLRTSALSDETLALARVRSLRKAADVAAALGYAKWRNGGGAIAFPVFLPERDDPAAIRLRPDCPRTNKSGAVVKYDQKPSQKGGPGIVVYFPPRSRTERLRGTTPLVWTEGEKKALLLDQLGYAAVGLTGVDCFHDKPAKDRGDGLKLHPWILEHVGITGRVHLVCFDSDARNKDSVIFAARRFAGLLRASGAHDVRFVDIPDQGADKFGIDDLYVKLGEHATRAVLDTTRPIEAIAPESPLMAVRDVAAFREAPDAVTKHLRVPEGYELNRDGALWEAPVGEAPPKLITPSAPIITCVLSDDNRHERLELVARSSSGAWRTVVVPRGTVVAGGIRATELLGNLGLDVLPRAEIGTWLAAFERINGTRLSRATITGRSGWHGEGDERVFLLGTTAIDNEGKVTSRVRFDEDGSLEIARTFRTGGTWPEHARLVRDALQTSGDAAAAAIFAALAVPLLKRLGAAPFGFHLWGKSSRGKTTALQLAAGIYGCPATHGEDSSIEAWDGTPKGLELFARTCSDLPVCLDESSTEEREKRSKAIYQIINGRGGLASKRDGSGLRSRRAWRTILISTGEQALAGDNVRTGAQVRTIEVYVDGLGGLGAEAVDEIKTRAVKHFGHVGRRWVEALVRLDDESWKTAQDRYESIVAELRKKCARHSLAARQTGFFALLVLAERMCARLLGLGDPEGAQMMRFAGAEETRLGVVPEEVRAARVLLDWMAAEPGAFPPVRPAPSQGAGDATLHELRERDAGGRGFAGFRGLYRGEDALFLIDTPVEARFSEQGLDLRTVAREWVRLGVAMTQGAHHKPKVRVGGGGTTRHWTLHMKRLEELCDSPAAPLDPGNGPEGKTGTRVPIGAPSRWESGDSAVPEGNGAERPHSQWGQDGERKQSDLFRKNGPSPPSPLLTDKPHDVATSRPADEAREGSGTFTRAHASIDLGSGDSGDSGYNDRQSLGNKRPHSRPQSVPSGDTWTDGDPDVFDDDDPDGWSAERCAAEGM